MRTFIAIPLSRECQETLDRVQGRLRAQGADVRWVSVPSIHLTLKFLGEVDSQVIPNLGGRLREETAGERPFFLEINGLGCFPDSRNPRVVWCGLDGAIDRLIHLQGSVEASCVALGFAPEDRPFHPHLTLGRIKGKRNLQHLMNELTTGVGTTCRFLVDRFHIYRSSLRPDGAVYSVLETIQLNE